MKNRHWIGRFGAGLLGTAMALNAVPMQTLLPVAAEETPAASNQMVSAPEIVPVDVVAATERTVLFNENWKFSLSDPSGAQNSSFDDSKWNQVTLPHDYSIDQDYTPLGEAESGYKLGGVGWYRKSFSMAPETQGKRVVVEFNGVYMDCTVYLNGHKLGEHPYGYTGFAFDLTDYINYEGENVISVRVIHQTPSSRWYSGSGIYRDVNLTVTDDVHVGYNGIAVTTPNLKDESTSVTTSTKTDVVNDSDAEKTVTVRQSVVDKDGSVIGTGTVQATLAAGEKKNVALDVQADSPKLWSTKEANLYTLKTEVLEGETVVDTVETTFGYRYYSFDAETGFYLNGEKIKLQGVCMHHDQGALGAEANDRAMERQVQILKKMGVNAIRITHNPGDPQFLEACSREGILVINELFDGWIGAKNGNTYDYSRFFQTSVAADNQILNKNAGDLWYQFDARSAVEESRNEPSVIMYSLGNEIFEGSWDWSSQSAALAQGIIDAIRTADTERIVTFGGNRLKNSTQEDAVANVIASNGGLVGYNYATYSQYRAARTSHSNWAIYGSETASHVNSRGVYNTRARNSLNADKLLTSYDTSAVGWGHVASDAWYAVIRNDDVAGEFVWTGFDYLGEPTPNNGTGAGWVNGTNSPKNSYFGIVDTAGLPKDSYYLYQSWWNDKVNTLHVLPAWNRDVVVNNGNGTVPVVVYSDAASVELFFTPAGSTTRQSLGKKTFTKKTTDAGYTYQIYEGEGKSSTEHENLYLTWNVQYQDGKIEAVAYDENDQVISDTEGRSFVETTGAASQIDLTADRDIKGDGADLSYVTIDIKDDQGRIVPSAKNAVTVKVEGAGELAGLDNGVQPDHQSYRDDNRKAQAGQLVAIVRSNGQSGDIKVTASADGLASKTITIHASEVAGEQKNGLVSFEMSKNYYVKTGTKPVLADTLKANYADGTSKEVPVVWDVISDEQVSEVGSFALKGVADGQSVTVSINVINEVSTLLNVSTAIQKGSRPVLPAVRQAVLDDGTVLDVNFDVTWQMPEDSAFAKVGDVEIPGSATVFGRQVPVTAFVRVADATTSLGDSVSGAAHLSQSIPEDQQSDTLEAIKDGQTVFDPNNKTDDSNNTCWTNYNYCYEHPENNTASITFRYDTQQNIGQIKVHFTEDTWSASFPDANTTTFEVSEDGVNWTPLETVETIGDAVDSYNKPYTYDIAPTMFTYLRLNITNATGTKPNNNHNKCTGIAEVELFSVTSNLTINSEAALASLSVDGTPLSQSMLEGKELTTPKQPGELEAAAVNNGAITILPVVNNKQVILVESEDGSKLSKYTLSYGVTSPDDDSRDIPREKLTANAGSAHTGEGPERALDNNPDTLWHCYWYETDSSKLWIEFDVDGDYLVDGLRYQPRQSGNNNGNITGYQIQVQDENGDWKEVATGTWANDRSWKTASFEPTAAKKVRLTVTDSISETSYRLAAAAEIRLTGEKAPDVEPTELDYSLLKTAIQKAEGLTQADYPDGDAKTALNTALDAANALDDKAQNQQSIDNAAKALNQALLALRLTPSKEKLNTLN